MKNLNDLNIHRLVDAEQEIIGFRGDSRNGLFKVFVNGKSFYCIASSGGGWEHVSVSPCSEKRKSCPTWEEMCVIKNMFFRPDETVVQYHPKESDYVNVHEYCLHMWRPTAETLPVPPIAYV